MRVTNNQHKTWRWEKKHTSARPQPLFFFFFFFFLLLSLLVNQSILGRKNREKNKHENQFGQMGKFKKKKHKIKGFFQRWWKIVISGEKVIAIPIPTPREEKNNKGNRACLCWTDSFQSHLPLSLSLSLSLYLYLSLYPHPYIYHT